MLRCLGSITTPMQLKSQYVMVAVKVKFDHCPPPNKLSCWCEPSWWLVLPELSEFTKLRVGRDEAITRRLCFMTEQVWMIYEHVVTHVHVVNV